MTNPAGNILGVRLRRETGFKFSVAGGKEGLFIPIESGFQTAPLLIAEGPTDTAALLDMGFASVVGRPSCAGGIKLLVELVRRGRGPEVVVVADGDEPGRSGADDLASVLVAYAATVRTVVPPEGVKDARGWLRAGGRRQDVEAAIRAAAARRLTVRAIAEGTQGGWMNA
jgi:hypothetical protein